MTTIDLVENAATAWAVYCLPMAIISCTVSQHMGNSVRFTVCYFSWLASPLLAVVFFAFGAVGADRAARGVYGLLYRGVFSD